MSFGLEQSSFDEKHGSVLPEELGEFLSRSSSRGTRSRYHSRALISSQALVTRSPSDSSFCFERSCVERDDMLKRMRSNNWKRHLDNKPGPRARDKSSLTPLKRAPVLKGVSPNIPRVKPTGASKSKDVKLLHENENRVNMFRIDG